MAELIQSWRRVMLADQDIMPKDGRPNKIRQMSNIAG
jgi:hypothetical protein